MIWLILAGVAVLVLYLIGKESDKKRVSKSFDMAENFFDEVQGMLKKEMWEKFSEEESILDEREFLEHSNQKRLEFEENNLWRKHIVAILASDKYSNEMKRQACSSWFDFIYYECRTRDGTTAYLDTDNMKDIFKSANSARDTFIGTMEAYGYDLEKESEKLEAEIAKKFPIKVHKRHKKSPKHPVGGLYLPE